MEENKAILVNLNDPKMVYAIPAKPKPRAPWYEKNAVAVLVILGCWIGIACIWAGG